MYGISHFSAVINPPQCGIMAIGSSKLSLNESGEPITIMTVTLSCDARAVDDATAARFLQEFQTVIENPFTMLSKLTRPAAIVDI